MEINGRTMESLLEEKFRELSEAANNITPEMEAAFEEKERQRLHKEGLDRITSSNNYAEIPKRFWDSSFSKYPSEISERAKELCLREKSDVIYILCGSTGRGKTTTLCSAIHERAYNGIGGGYYFTMRNLEMELRRCRNFDYEDDYKTFMTHLTDCSFLCIDEVGTCLNKAEEVDFLIKIISARYDNYLPTWIATNLTPIEFKAYLCNLDITGKTREELVRLSTELDNNVVILNRIKSVAVYEALVGESYRSAANGSVL